MGNKNGLTELKNQITGLQTAVLGGKDKDKKTTVETIGSGVVSGNAVAGTSSAAVSGAAAVPEVPAAAVSQGGIGGQPPQ